VNLNEIRTFVTVAHTGSIQAVAHDAVCGVTAVRRLEQDLGATLFDRQTKTLALNHDGRVALEHGQRVLNATEAFSEALPRRRTERCLAHRYRACAG
jgi:DNA-binding transcriptional LysR family regulator